MATQLGPIDWKLVRSRVAQTGIFRRPTMFHPKAVNPILALQQRGIIAKPTTTHPPGAVTGGNARRP